MAKQSPEERKAKQKAYYEANKEAKLEKCRQYCAANKEKVAETKTKYYETKKETIKNNAKRNYNKNNNRIAQIKEYHKTSNGKANHKKATAKYRKVHPEKYTNVSIRSFLTFICKEYILERDKHQCQLCNKGFNVSLVVHHIYPVQHDQEAEHILNPRNLVILCQECHKKAHKYCWKSLDMKIAKQLMGIIKIKELTNPTVLPKYQPTEKEVA